MASGALRALDRDILALVQTPDSSPLDLASSIVSLGGASAVTAGLALGLTVARLRVRRPDFWVPLAIGATLAIEVVLKLTVGQPTPPEELSRSIELLPTIDAGLPFAFPSGHVARSLFLLATVRAPAWLLVIAFVLMGLTRVYLGEHWATDVIGGALLGLGVAWLATDMHSPRVNQTFV